MPKHRAHKKYFNQNTAQNLQTTPLQCQSFDQIHGEHRLQCSALHHNLPSKQYSNILVLKFQRMALYLLP